MSSSSLYVWQEQEPNGDWGTIAAIIVPHLPVAPLISRSRELAQRHFAHLAKTHHQDTGRPVRLARYDYGLELMRYE